ncbi:hypothetical protein [Methanimicrococcus hacksteinii]|uniref:hypothetical protein n=1 Tax=Methanimicrococcus hacksteinii TaxID=3028293 RepID=UPI00298F30E6|nr:hypothetical protein [Methanimicrococcus sp. At1]
MSAASIRRIGDFSHDSQLTQKTVFAEIRFVSAVIGVIIGVCCLSQCSVSYASALFYHIRSLRERGHRLPYRLRLAQITLLFAFGTDYLTVFVNTVADWQARFCCRRPRASCSVFIFIKIIPCFLFLQKHFSVFLLGAAVFLFPLIPLPIGRLASAAPLTRASRSGFIFFQNRISLYLSFYS